MFLKGISPVRDSIILPSLCHKRIIKKYKKIISQMVASCQIREWEPENATVSESIENVEKYSK